MFEHVPYDDIGIFKYIRQRQLYRTAIVSVSFTTSLRFVSPLSRYKYIFVLSSFFKLNGNTSLTLE